MHPHFYSKQGTIPAVKGRFFIVLTQRQKIHITSGLPALHTLGSVFIVFQYILFHALKHPVTSSASYVYVSKHSGVLQPPDLSGYLKIYRAINGLDEIHDEILSFTETQ